MASKAADGSHSKSSAPAMPPSSEAVPGPQHPSALTGELRPVAHAPESEPGASPTVLETLAITGARPAPAESET